MDFPSQARNIRSLKQCRAAYKKRNGFKLSEKMERQLDRAAELDDRARKLREKEGRKKENAFKRQKKVFREAEARDQLGIGLATQLAGYNHTQKASKGFMEKWTGLSKKRADREKSPEPNAARTAIAAEEHDEEHGEHLYTTSLDDPLNE
jgi:hypothetical protein